MFKRENKQKCERADREWEEREETSTMMYKASK